MPVRNKAAAAAAVPARPSIDASAVRAPALPVLHRLADLQARITRAPGVREALSIRAPFTGQVIGTVPACTEADVQLAVRRARAAQVGWAQWPAARRRDVLLRYHDRILNWQETLLDLVQLESGKARRHAFEEVLDVANNARHYAYRAAAYLQPQRRKGALPLLTRTHEHRHPVGVVGLIAPWNYPLALAASDAIPALLAGNAVILKPAEQTSYTALLAVQMLYEAGLPEHVFQVVTGRGSEAGPPLIDAVDFVGFTGSTSTGRRVAEQAGRRLIKSSLELGGKNPMVVLNDADVPKAVAGALQGCFTSAGQLCIAIERLYVQRGVYDAFLAAFVDGTRRLRLGAPFDYSVDVGSLVSEAQRDRVQACVQDAVARGATLRCGGRARPDLGPFFFEPTILTGVTPEMQVAREETFGPVVSVYPFDAVDEGIAMANDSAYGLNASIWTRDVQRGRRLARQIACGTVNINDAFFTAWGSVDAPMGGMKASGFGRRHGREGFLKYTTSQTVAVQHLWPMTPPPFLKVEDAARLMTTAMRLFRHLPGLR